MDKAKLMAAPKPAPKTDAIEVPGWGRVLVRELNQAEYERVEAAGGKPGRTGFATDRALVVRLAVVNEAGENVFTDTDLPWLRDQPLRVVSPITKRAFELTGLGGGDDAGN